jgi:hypothetical protein
MPSPKRNERESTKQRALRIPLDYYRTLSWPARGKWLFSGAALLVAMGYAIWIAAAPGGKQQASPAPLAAVHGAWNSDCQACHTPGVPLRGDSNGLATLLANSTASARAANDAKCSACHAGHAHHANQREEEVQSCAGCHRDHQGKDFALTRVADSVCTDCHGDAHGIESHIADGELSLFTPSLARIRSFGSHPDFRSLAGARDPGHIKFNHHLHMLPGQFPAGTAGPPDTAKRTFGSIEERYWPRLGFKDGDTKQTLVQLQCASCHESDADGAYMQPVNFERHCAACHEGDLRLAGPIAGSVPHGLSPAEIRTVLIGLASGKPAGKAELSPTAPLRTTPGKTPGANLAQEIDLPQLLAVQQAEAALAPLTATEYGAHCAKCHEFGERDAAGDLMPAVKPASMPATWLTLARFDHAAHQNMSCRDCHAAAYPDEKASAAELFRDSHGGVMVPGIANCRQCHGARFSATPARSDCVECHRYHGSAPSTHPVRNQP